MRVREDHSWAIEFVRQTSSSSKLQKSRSPLAVPLHPQGGYPTVGRLEIGRVRPSISLLEKLAGALQCRVRDMLVEEPRTEREPSMLGAPNYFRLGIRDAARAALLPRDINTGETERCDYSSPGFHLAIHFDNYLTDEAREELDMIFAIKNPRTCKRRFWAFLERDFPGCIALVPMDRRDEFLKGFALAIEDGRFSWSR